MFESTIEPTDKHPHNHLMRVDRGIQEMLGLVHGIICDGKVTHEEASALKHWVEYNSDLHKIWPIYVLSERLRKIFDDGIVDKDERLELHDILMQLQDGGLQRSTSLPISNPLPQLIFEGHTYVFTGKFAFGTRKACEQRVLDRGGRCTDSVSDKTNFVVIGEIGSADWKFSAWGRKIHIAVEKQRLGRKIHIIPEEHWVKAII